MKRLSKLPSAIIAIAIAIGGSTAPAHAGLLDLLFGGGQQQPTYQTYPSNRGGYQPAPQDGFVAPAEDLAKRKAREAARAAAVQRAAAEQAARDLQLIHKLAEVAKEQGPKAAFMMDPTLRSGDIVVTRAGIEVFQGGGGRVHLANQFRPLASSSYRGRNDLALLQKASGFTGVVSAAASPAPEPRPLTIQGKRANAGKAADVGIVATR